MGWPHLGHSICKQDCPAACGVFSPHFEQTQNPPGPAADGPPIPSEPGPGPPPCLRWPPPRPAPIPNPLGMTFSPSRRQHLWQPGITNARLARLSFKYAANTSSTIPQEKPITCTPAAIKLLCNSVEIAPQTRTSAPKLKNSATRAGASVLSSRLSPRRTSWPYSMSINKRWPATSNTGEIRPCHSGIAILIGNV
jgi:hypothetical protein